MTKSNLFTLMVVGSSVVFAGNVQASGHRGCAAVPATASVPVNSPGGAPLSQGSRTTTYQSYSYEPGTTQVFRPMSRPTNQSFYDSVRGDRKVRGF